MRKLPKRFTNPTDPAAYPQEFWASMRHRRRQFKESDMADPPCTYRWLRDQLNALTESQLDQLVQVYGPDKGRATEPARLQPAYAVGTVADLFHVGGEVEKEVRGPDNAHHPEQVVICIDYPGFSLEGDTHYTAEEGGWRGDVTGKLFDRPGGREPVPPAGGTGATDMTDERLAEIESLMADSWMLGQLPTISAAANELLAEVRRLRAVLDQSAGGARRVGGLCVSEPTA